MKFRFSCILIGYRASCIYALQATFFVLIATQCVCSKLHVLKYFLIHSTVLFRGENIRLCLFSGCKYFFFLISSQCSQYWMQFNLLIFSMSRYIFFIHRYCTCTSTEFWEWCWNFTCQILHLHQHVGKWNVFKTCYCYYRCWLLCADCDETNLQYYTIKYHKIRVHEYGITC